MRRIPALDALRLLAALAVALYHYTTFWSPDGVHNPAHFLPSLSRVTVYGFLGVEMFFMISGFVIGMSSWGKRIGDYAVSRVARLYPAYWACIAITLVFTTLFPVTGGWMPVYDDFTWVDIGINLTMLQHPLGHPSVDNVYWTLWVELRFYLLWALVVGRGVTYRRAVLFCVVWMTAAVLAVQVNHPVLTMLTMPTYAGYFCAGILLYLVRRFGGSPLLWAMLAFTWLVNLHSLNERVQLNPGWTVPLWPAALIVTAIYLTLAAIATGRADRLDWRWLTVAGALTYPYYLLHQRLGYILIRHGMVDADLPLELLVPATMAIMLVPAWLVHRLVERRFGPLLRDALHRGLADLRRDHPEPVERPAAAGRDPAGVPHQVPARPGPPAGHAPALTGHAGRYSTSGRPGPP
ncbi:MULTISPECIES: acyltransferase family protein [Catenuloplanes]|uniref:Peptidoglycan/LPS O-acetylase OafA/YrhL n=1 Tax=Catenuloplanes niger TaxID=587534 RepID=A0AAE3ZVG1_9ACTN|nr:acyltransferase [Catenuloplanes niger]MDR7326794.1 peptidoglycan/LPS O-acetylase OafA/YrhL [Catenuloplanes niger]